MRILVVDDEVQVARSLQRLLKKHDVSIETDAGAALDRVTTALADGSPFDVVLCDFSMDGMTGAEVIAALLTCEPCPLLILMSGDCVADRTSDADAVLMKPFTPDELRTAIEQAGHERAEAPSLRFLGDSHVAG